jgi:hypothetical protein
MTIRSRTAALIAALALALAGLTGCESEGAKTDCSLDSCTVTFDRSADARASVLGVEAKLVSVQDDKVTVEVAGEQVTLTTGQAAADAGDFQVSLQSVTDQEVVVKIGRSGG